MITPKVSFGQHALAAMTVIFVLGALSMIWPGIIALVFGVFLLVQSFVAEQQFAILSWAEVSNAPIVFTSLRRFDPSAILS